MKRLIILIIGILAVTLASISLPPVTSANHSWGGYHWARTSNPFNLKLGDNLSPSWKPYLRTTSTDWSISSVLDTATVSGQSKGNCQPTAGRVEVCNKTYGNNGWLGIAQIWASGSHITQGVTKLNDTYFNTPSYNTSAWKNLVTCQEVGHTLGLDHQDEIFDNANLGTCMDYTNNPSTNQHPNQHDYDQLGVIYSHLDKVTTLNQTKASIASGNFENRSEWGRELKNNGRIAKYERDFGGGNKLFTFVVLAVDN